MRWTTPWVARYRSSFCLDETRSCRATVNAQPAIMAVSLASIKAMEEVVGSDAMPRPAFVAGHSLGEYTALAVAGVLDVGETARLVQERGRLMQEACDHRPGTMAAVLGLDLLTMEEIARETGTYLSNVNTPEQVVISGDRLAVAQALDLASARGAKRVVPLRGRRCVSLGPHGSLSGMAWQRPSTSSSSETRPCPIVANCTGKPLTTGRGSRAGAGDPDMQLRPVEASP